MFRPVIACVTLVVAIGCDCYANGYKMITVGSARTTAVGDAFVAEADDPSAVAFNPAGLAQLRGVQLDVGVVVMNGFVERISPQGVETNMKDRWQVLPSVYMSADMGFKDVGFGLGVSFPNGLSSEWGDNSFARYVDTYSRLTVVDISPAVGVRIGENLLFGAGVDLYYAEAKLKNMMDIGLQRGVPGQLDTERVMDGNGAGWGGNIGAVYQINDRSRVGLTYRLPHRVNLNGDVTVDATGFCSDVETAVDFPGVVVAGYSFKPVKRLRLEFDLDWTDWRSVDDLVIRFKIPGLSDFPQRRDLHNTVAYKLGAEYQHTAKVVLRGGYIYNENATPVETWRPSLPDADSHMISAGVGYTVQGITVDTALQYVYYRTRVIGNNVDNNEAISSSSIDGTYRNWAPCISVSVRYCF